MLNDREKVERLSLYPAKSYLLERGLELVLKNEWTIPGKNHFFYTNKQHTGNFWGQKAGVTIVEETKGVVIEGTPGGRALGSFLNENASKISRDDELALWYEASRCFAQSAKGAVFALCYEGNPVSKEGFDSKSGAIYSKFPRTPMQGILPNTSDWHRAELPVLLFNPQVTSINNIPREDLQRHVSQHRNPDRALAEVTRDLGHAALVYPTGLKAFSAILDPPLGGYYFLDHRPELMPLPRPSSYEVTLFSSHGVSSRLGHGSSSESSSSSLFSSSNSPSPSAILGWNGPTSTFSLQKSSSFASDSWEAYGQVPQGVLSVGRARLDFPASEVRIESKKNLCIYFGENLPALELPITDSEAASIYRSIVLENGNAEIGAINATTLRGVSSYDKVGLAFLRADTLLMDYITGTDHGLSIRDLGKGALRACIIKDALLSSDERIALIARIAGKCAFNFSLIFTDVHLTKDGSQILARQDVLLEPHIQLLYRNLAIQHTGKSEDQRTILPKIYPTEFRAFQKLESHIEEVLKEEPLFARCSCYSILAGIFRTALQNNLAIRLDHSVSSALSRPNLIRKESIQGEGPLVIEAYRETIEELLSISPAEYSKKLQAIPKNNHQDAVQTSFGNSSIQNEAIVNSLFALHFARLMNSKSLEHKAQDYLVEVVSALGIAGLRYHAHGERLRIRVLDEFSRAKTREIKVQVGLKRKELEIEKSKQEADLVSPSTPSSFTKLGNDRALPLGIIRLKTEWKEPRLGEGGTVEADCTTYLELLETIKNQISKNDVMLLKDSNFFYLAFRRAYDNSVRRGEGDDNLGSTEHSLIRALRCGDFDCDAKCMLFYDVATLFSYKPWLVNIPGHQIVRIADNFYELTFAATYSKEKMYEVYGTWTDHTDSQAQAEIFAIDSIREFHDNRGNLKEAYQWVLYCLGYYPDSSYLLTHADNLRARTNTSFTGPSSELLKKKDPFAFIHAAHHLLSIRAPAANIIDMAQQAIDYGSDHILYEYALNLGNIFDQLGDRSNAYLWYTKALTCLFPYAPGEPLLTIGKKGILKEAAPILKRLSIIQADNTDKNEAWRKLSEEIYAQMPA